MPAAIPTPMEKCKGAMLATAIGDALGWPVEQRSKNRSKNPKVSDFFVEWTRSCSQPAYHDEHILPGEYSDDTQMTLAVARSIIAGDWEKHLAEKELPYWLQYERGGGRALLKAARSVSEKKVQLWQSNYTKDYFNAGGNGAAMRILPHIIAAQGNQDLSTLMLDVVKDTLITHGHPRAFLGATCYAYALDFLLRKDAVLEYGELVSALIDGQLVWGAFLKPDLLGYWLGIANQHADFNFAHVWEATRDNMVRQLDYVKTALKKGLMLDDTKVLTDLDCFGNVNGAGDVAALAAIYLASKYANNPALGIKVPAFSFGADTDTIASMTGGLLGMLSGTSWIPAEWKRVQDFDCLVQMTELLSSDNRIEATKSEVSETKSPDSKWITTPMGKMRLIDTKEALNGKRGIVIIKKWQTALGQTIYTKDLRLFNNRDQQHTQDAGQMRFDMQSNPVAQKPKPPQLAIQPAPVPETVQKPIAPVEKQKRFVLDSATIKVLLENPEFKNNITVGKVFKVVQAFLESEDSAADIAWCFELDEVMVNLIRACVK